MSRACICVYECDQFVSTRIIILPFSPFVYSLSLSSLFSLSPPSPSPSPSPLPSSPLSLSPPLPLPPSLSHLYTHTHTHINIQQFSLNPPHFVWLMTQQRRHSTRWPVSFPSQMLPLSACERLRYVAIETEVTLNFIVHMNS